jgi:hypothetical protein
MARRHNSAERFAENSAYQTCRRNRVDMSCTLYRKVAIRTERHKHCFKYFRWETGVRQMKRMFLVPMIGVVFGCLMYGVSARDLGQWEAIDPAVKAWFESLMQPDIPQASCCGEADAYWADSYEVDGDKYVAIITDTRPDEPLRRKHIEIGTKIVVPNYKLKYDKSNPTGHGIIFLSRADYVYCYVAPGGV